jgi:hypothetical protein
MKIVKPTVHGSPEASNPKEPYYLLELAAIKMGSDPELFVSGVDPKSGRKFILPSNEVIPEQYTGLSIAGRGLKYSSRMEPAVVRDGIQLELHPAASHCRQILAENIRDSLKALATRIKASPNLKLDFTQAIKLPKAAMENLDPSILQLGCMPSFNAYGRKFKQPEGTEYPWRFAGGHIHLGMNLGARYHVWYDHHTHETLKIKVGNPIEPEQLAKIMDIFVGLPSVLLDRNPEAARRRKTYGLAGEFRLPPHGFEYRTLSNFWLRSYQLASFVFGQSWQAVQFTVLLNKIMTLDEEHLKFFNGHSEVAAFRVLRESMNRGYARRLVQMRSVLERLVQDIPQDLVEEAINTNDFKLAKRLFAEHLIPFYTNLQSSQKGLNKHTLPGFLHWVDEGIEKIFPDEPMQNWPTRLLSDGSIQGFERSAEDLARKCQIDIHGWQKNAVAA